MKIRNKLLMLTITLAISYTGQIWAVDAEALEDELKKKAHQETTNTSDRKIILTSQNR